VETAEEILTRIVMESQAARQRDDVLAKRITLAIYDRDHKAIRGLINDRINDDLDRLRDAGQPAEPEGPATPETVDAGADGAVNRSPGVAGAE